MIECKICGEDTGNTRVYCCNGWECNCRAQEVNEEEDYYCEECKEAGKHE